MSPRARFLKLDSDAQERILSAARSEFSQHGFQKASLNRIIEQTGMSKGAVYYYFDDKADLFLHVTQCAVTQMMQATGGIAVGEMPETDFWGEVERAALSGWAYTEAHPELAGLLRAAFSLRPDSTLSHQVHAYFEQMYATFFATLEHGQKMGEVRTDLPMGFLGPVLFAMGEAMDRWSLQALESGELSFEDAGAFARKSVNLIRRVAAPEEPIQ